MTRCIPIVLTLACAAAGAAPTDGAVPVDQGSAPAPPLPEGWANDSTFYLLFVRSFADSTTGPLAGDGVGDLRGIIERLDYLNDGDPSTTTDLGVTGLWLMPIFEAPSYHGYDTVDYGKIDADYGSERDLRELLDACHARGVRVVLDLVLNHTSWRHPWFEASADPESPKRDWFRWSPGKPSYPGPWGQEVWHEERLEDAGAYYYGAFWHGMPDLNYRTRAVTDQMFEVSRRWLEFGVDGYRLDAIRHLIEDGEAQSSTPETLDWCRAFTEFCDGVRPGQWNVGEVWSDREDVARYLRGERPALHSCFDFSMAYDVVEGLRDQNPGRIRDGLAHSWRLYENRASTFLTNHDMDRATSRWQRDPGMARAAATILLTAPGIPFLYYGEEIGMQGAGAHENLRTPMQWTDDPATCGFTTGEPWIAPHDDVRLVNVERESADDRSLLNLHRRLIHLRNSSPALARGGFTPVDASDDRVVAFVRAEASERFLVMVNTSPLPVRGCTVAAGGLGVDEGERGVERLHAASIEPVAPGQNWAPIRLMRPYTGYVIELP